MSAVQELRHQNFPDETNFQWSIGSGSLEIGDRVARRTRRNCVQLMKINMVTIRNVLEIVWTTWIDVCRDFRLMTGFATQRRRRRLAVLKNQNSRSMINIHLSICAIKELHKINLWTRFGCIMVDVCRIIAYGWVLICSEYVPSAWGWRSRKKIISLESW